MLFNPEIELLPIAKLRQIQTERLQCVLQRVYQTIPFYKKKYDEAGINIGKIRTLFDLRQLPFTQKDDLRTHYPFGLFATPLQEVIRLHCSSGTTGKPIVVGYTKKDLEMFAEVVARSLVAGGCTAGMTLQNAFGYGLFTGGLGVHYGAEKIGMTVIPTSGGNTERQIMLMKDFQAEALTATPSYALTMAEELRRTGDDIRNYNLKIAILGAEPWSESLRGEVESIFNAKASNIYGLTEIIGPGVSNEDWEEQGTGSYVWEDHFYPEIVDKDTGAPLPYGTPGVLVLTTLSKEATPMIRYWTGDITTLSYEHSYKRTMIKMGPIMGRTDDMVVLRGINFFPTQIADLITYFPELTANYQIKLTREQSRDKAEVQLELQAEHLGYEKTDKTTSDITELFSGLAERIQQKIRERIGLSMQVTLHLPDTLPKSEGGKLKRLIDLRGKIF